MINNFKTILSFDIILRGSSAACPLAVPKIFFRLGATENFDRYAIYHSLNPTLSAVVINARHQLEYYSEFDKHFKNNIKLNGGEEGIRTLVGFPPNGFQDRLVMTTSIPLRMCLSILSQVPLNVNNKF